jgi:hypothetical protein
MLCVYLHYHLHSKTQTMTHRRFAPQRVRTLNFAAYVAGDLCEITVLATATEGRATERLDGERLAPPDDEAETEILQVNGAFDLTDLILDEAENQKWFEPFFLEILHKTRAGGIHEVKFDDIFGAFTTYGRGEIERLAYECEVDFSE